MCSTCILKLWQIRRSDSVTSYLSRLLNSVKIAFLQVTKQHVLGGMVVFLPFWCGRGDVLFVIWQKRGGIYVQISPGCTHTHIYTQITQAESSKMIGLASHPFKLPATVYILVWRLLGVQECRLQECAFLWRHKKTQQAGAFLWRHKKAPASAFLWRHKKAPTGAQEGAFLECAKPSWTDFPATEM